MTFCDQCGASLRLEARFCQGCGERVADVDVPVAPLILARTSDSPTSRSRTLPRLPIGGTASNLRYRLARILRHVDVKTLNSSEKRAVTVAFSAVLLALVCFALVAPNLPTAPWSRYRGERYSAIPVPHGADSGLLSRTTGIITVDMTDSQAAAWYKKAMRSDGFSLKRTYRTGGDETQEWEKADDLGGKHLYVLNFIGRGAQTDILLVTYGP